MTENIFIPPYKVREAAIRGKYLAVSLEANPEPGDTEESGRHMTVQEAGNRGGRNTLENQGRDFFSRIGKKGGKRTAKLYRELLSEFGKRGGRPRRLALDNIMREEDRQ